MSKHHAQPLLTAFAVRRVCYTEDHRLFVRTRMCGLFAGLGQAASHPAFEAAFTGLRHRGPDATEIIQLDGRVTLAFHRLAIIDTSHAGDQPFHSTDRRFWLMCNGEIYNHAALRAHYQDSYAFASHSDCEVILPLFAEFGIAEAARRLDAEFALIIWDSTAAKLYAARDPLGIRPLFYGYNSIDGGMVFASEAKALTPLCPDVRPNLHPLQHLCCLTAPECHQAR